MKAIILKGFGSVDELVYQDIPIPAIKADEVLIEVKAISINPVDVKTRKGKGQAGRLKDQHPIILGWDLSGIVSSVGNQVSDFKAGDEVFGMVNIPGHGKAYAAFVAAPEAHLAKKPVGITHEEAAAAGIAAVTAWQALTKKGSLQEGQTILIQAASGGVGHYAVQMAKYLGAHVIGVSSSANRDFVLSLGADEHIDYTSTPFEEVAPRVDFVLESIGGENIDRSLKVLKEGGTIVSLPSGLSEDVAEKAAAQKKMGIFFMVQSNTEDIRELGELLQKGFIRSHVSETFAFTDMKQAHVHMESGRTKGKIVVVI